MKKTPAELGLYRIQDWRPLQYEAGLWGHLLKKFAGIIVAPTGSGKTETKWASARLDNVERVHSLTSTKALQQQDVDAIPGLFKMQGRNNYDCAIDPILKVDQAPCQSGWNCPVRYACQYFVDKQKLFTAKEASLSYALFLAFRQYVEKFTPPNLLLCDEAHKIPQELENAVSFKLSQYACNEAGFDFPDKGIDNIALWAEKHIPIINKQLEDLLDLQESLGDKLLKDSDKRKLRALRSLSVAISNLQWYVLTDRENWIAEQTTQPVAHQFLPIWVKDYGHLLFQGVGKALLYSATIPNPAYFAESIGLPEWQSLPLPSQFAPERNPIVIDPISHKMNKQTEYPGSPAWEEMIEKIDEICDRTRWRTSKGMIHSVSYARARYIMTHSRHRQRMRMPDAATKEAVLKAFKESTLPLILVSPNTWEGIDLPYDKLSFQIVPKIDYPNLGSPQIKARIEQDDRYVPNHISLVWQQTHGRVMRAPDDEGVTFVTDPAASFYLKRWGDYFPVHFHKAVRYA